MTQIHKSLGTLARDTNGRITVHLDSQPRPLDHDAQAYLAYKVKIGERTLGDHVLVHWKKDNGVLKILSASLYYPHHDHVATSNTTN